MDIKTIYILPLENKTKAMKKIFFLLILLSTISCEAQGREVKVIEFNKGYEDMKYIFARISPSKSILEELYNGGLFARIFQLSDSKVTPTEYMEDFLSSYIISVTEDGDYYTESKLYKIEGMYDPKVLEVKETKYPSFNIKIEYGPYNKREVKNFELKGI